jgi:hypothetical protein
MTIANPAVNKVFNDLEAFKDYCRFEGKVFNEADLYKKDAQFGLLIKSIKVGCEQKHVMQMQDVDNA